MNVPRFESPFLERFLEEAELTAVQGQRLREFADRGLLVMDLEVADFDRIAAGIEVALADEYLRSENRVKDAWRQVPETRELATLPEILDLLRLLYGREPVPFQTLNFLSGTEQATHSDLVHFSSLPMRFMAGVWIALEDIHPDSGPLHYYPGSHRLPVFELHDIGLSNVTLRNRDAQYESYEQFLSDLMDAAGLTRETVTLRKGQALIWASNLAHGGEPIADAGRTRHSQVTHNYFSDCRYYTPLYSDPPIGRYDWSRVTNIRTGEEQPHMYAGKVVRLPPITRARYLIEDRMLATSPGRTARRAARRVLAGRTS